MHLTKEMDNQLLQLRREYQQPSQSPLALTSDSWDPYMLHEELKLFMAAPGRLRNAISWKGFTNFKALWTFVIYPQKSKGCQQSMAMSRVSRLYSIASGATWPDRKGDGKVTLLTVHGAKTAVWRHRKRLPKSRPIAKGFDAILLHCHLRCDFVFACSAQGFFEECMYNLHGVNLGYAKIGCMKNHKGSQLIGWSSYSTWQTLQRIPGSCGTSRNKRWPQRSSLRNLAPQRPPRAWHPAKAMQPVSWHYQDSRS